MPKVSVLMTAYNAEKYIQKSIHSVISQTFIDFEFLIIDDASTDETFSIIESFSDPRIIAVKKEQNNGFKGYVENLNLLLSKAKGQYIARIDADDIWHQNKLEVQVKFLEENAEIFLTGCSQAYKINELGNREGIIRLLPNTHKFDEYILKKNPIIHPSIVFRNIKGIEYRWKMMYAEDYDFHLMNISKGLKYHISDENLMDYRILEGSLSHNKKTLISALFVSKVIDFYIERMKNKGEDSYEYFDPNDILKVLDVNHSNTLPMLLRSLRFAFIAGKKEDFKILFKKVKKQHKISQVPYMYRIIRINFDLFYKLYQFK